MRVENARRISSGVFTVFCGDRRRRSGRSWGRRCGEERGRHFVPFLPDTHHTQLLCHRKGKTTAPPGCALTLYLGRPRVAAAAGSDGSSMAARGVHVNSYPVDGAERCRAKGGEGKLERWGQPFAKNEETSFSRVNVAACDANFATQPEELAPCSFVPTVPGVPVLGGRTAG